MGGRSCATGDVAATLLFAARTLGVSRLRGSGFGAAKALDVVEQQDMRTQVTDTLTAKQVVYAPLQRFRVGPALVAGCQHGLPLKIQEPLVVSYALVQHFRNLPSHVRPGGNQVPVQSPMEGGRQGNAIRRPVIMRLLPWNEVRRVDNRSWTGQQNPQPRSRTAIVIGLEDQAAERPTPNRIR